MLLEKWLVQRISQEVTDADDKMRQFALEATIDRLCDEFTDTRAEFALVGVWALQNPLPVFRAMKDREPFTVLVGMRPASAFHIGHLTLMRELCWLVKCGGQPVFVFAGYEAGKFITANDAKLEMARFAETYLGFTGSLLPETAESFSDRECRDIQILYERAAEHLSVRKVMQLYGWDERVSVARLSIPAIIVATFLFPVIRFPNRSTLVLSDIHQITHAEATKIVARRLHVSTPSYSYRMLLPSLEGSVQRMSVKNIKSVIFLNETREQITSKLQQSFSGGCPSAEEQRRKGGDPYRCSFFKIAEVLQSHDETTQMYEECVCGEVLCSECKTKHIPVLLESIQKSFVS